MRLQLRPQFRHFAGLVDEGIFQAQRRGQQREPLVGAAGFQPGGRVVARRGEQQQARRAADVAFVGRVCVLAFSEVPLKSCPTQRGTDELPVARPSSPSREASASRSLKRTQ